MPSNRLSSPYWANTYAELITFYPRYYREVFEMDAILQAQGHLLDGVLTAAEHILSNFFIDEADEATIVRLEKWLDISFQSKRTLEERRRIVKSFFAGMGKTSATAIADIIWAYTGAQAHCELVPFDAAGNNRLSISFDRGSKPVLYWSDIIQILDRRIPAHIQYEAVLTYRFAVGIERKRAHYPVGYEFSGTKPETVLVGAVRGVATATKPVMKNALMTYRQSKSTGSESEVGKYPQTTTLATHGVIDAAVEALPMSSGIDYIPCGTITASS